MGKQIKVMQIVQSLECGGLEKVAISLADGLQKRFWDVSICCLDKPGNLAPEALNKNINVINIGKKSGIDFSLVTKLAKIFKKENVKVVHTHNMGPLIYGTLASRLAGVPVVINTRHGRERKRCSRFIWLLNNEVVTISFDAKNKLLESNRIDANKIKVIYNGIKIDEFEISEENNYRKRLSLTDNDYVIGTVARLSLEKDQKTLIDAFEIICKQFENARLIIVGDGLLRAELEEHCVNLKIKNKVFFMGFRDDVANILNIFDVFVLSSRTEGISLTLLEAMAAGKPIVATDVGGNPEVVADGVTGVLVPTNDPIKMAKSIINILENKKLSKAMAGNGRKRVEEIFSQEKMVMEYEKLYKFWLNKKGVV